MLLSPFLELKSWENKNLRKHIAEIGPRRRVWKIGRLSYANFERPTTRVQKNSRHKRLGGEKKSLRKNVEAKNGEKMKNLLKGYAYLRSAAGIEKRPITHFCYSGLMAFFDEGLTWWRHKGVFNLIPLSLFLYSHQSHFVRAFVRPSPC